LLLVYIAYSFVTAIRNIRSPHFGWQLAVALTV